MSTKKRKAPKKVSYVGTKIAMLTLDWGSTDGDLAAINDQAEKGWKVVGVAGTGNANKSMVILQKES